MSEPRWLPWPLGLMVGALSIGELGCETLIGADFGEKHLAIRDSSTEHDAEGAGCAMYAGAVASTAGDDSLDLTFAVRTLELGDAVGGDGGFQGPSFGITPAELGTCRWPPEATWPHLPTSVGPSGLVNAAADAVHTFVLTYPVLSIATTVTDGIQKGNLTPLFRLRGYNGTPEDPEVALDVFPGAALQRTASSASGESGHDPDWLGDDTWLPLPDFLRRTGGGWAPLISLHGSVEASTLRIERQDGPEWLANVHIEATLTHLPEGWHLQGYFAGGARMTTLFKQASTHSPLLCTDQPLFHGSPGVPGFKQIWCQRRDMDTDGDGSCDAVSLAQRFDAVPARLGCKPSKAPEQCPAPTDPGQDQCEPVPPVAGASL